MLDLNIIIADSRLCTPVNKAPRIYNIRSNFDCPRFICVPFLNFSSMTDATIQKQIEAIIKTGTEARTSQETARKFLKELMPKREGVNDNSATTINQKKKK